MLVRIDGINNINFCIPMNSGSFSSKGGGGGGRQSCPDIEDISIATLAVKKGQKIGGGGQHKNIGGRPIAPT